MADLVAIETSTLVLLSFVSLMLCAYLLMVCWRFYSYNHPSSDSKSGSQQLSIDWLDLERKPLIPGNFTARTIQPSPPESEDEDYDEGVAAPTDLEERNSLGRVIFVLRYSSEREELMVRLIQIEGMSPNQAFYNMDTAYVDVHLEYIGPIEQEQKYSNPPKLDLCLQQVYYFIISRSQLLVHALVFRVNTFDEEYRRTVCGEVRVQLVEELKHNMFTGSEVFLIKEIVPVSKGLYAQEEVIEVAKDIEDDVIEDVMEDDRGGALSPASSHMSWEPEYLQDEITDIDTVPSSDTTSRSGDSVPWKRLRKRKRRGITSPSLSTFGSITSMPSAFKFPPDRKMSLEPDFQTLIEVPDFGRLSKKFSVSDTYMPRYSSLNPPPEDFYHLLPDTPLTAKDLVSEKLPRHVSPVKRSRWTSLRRKFKRLQSDANPVSQSGREIERSNSWPSLTPSSTSCSQHENENDAVR